MPSKPSYKSIPVDMSERTPMMRAMEPRVQKLEDKHIDVMQALSRQDAFMEGLQKRVDNGFEQVLDHIKEIKPKIDAHELKLASLVESRDRNKGHFSWAVGIVTTLALTLFSVWIAHKW